MCDFETKLLKNNFKYLYEVAKCIPKDSASTILKSHLYTKCRNLQYHEFNCELPQFKATIRCPRCSMLFDEGSPSVKVIPDKNKSRFIRRVLKKYSNNVKLTKYQLESYNNYITNGKSKLEVTCNICKKSTFRPIDKPVTIPDSPKIDIKRSAKKKKKKDKFCGLNESIILSLIPELPKKKVETNSSIEIKPKLSIKTLKKMKITSIKQENFKSNKKFNKLNDHLTKNSSSRKSGSKLKAFLDSI